MATVSHRPRDGKRVYPVSDELPELPEDAYYDFEAWLDEFGIDARIDDDEVAPLD